MGDLAWLCVTTALGHVAKAWIGHIFWCWPMSVFSVNVVMAGDVRFLTWPMARVQPARAFESGHDTAPGLVPSWLMPASIIAGAAMIGPLISRSIAPYSFRCSPEASVGRLFLAGAGAWGCFGESFLCFQAYFVAKINNYALMRELKCANLRQRWRDTVVGLPVLCIW